MAYVIPHSFLPETVVLAEDYKLIAINEQQYYKYFQNYLKSGSYYLSDNLDHYITETYNEFLKLLNRVKQEDRKYFRPLVRALIYEHYFEELVKPNTDKPLSYFLGKIEVLSKLNKPIPTMLQNKPETVMNTLDKYKDQTKVEVTLIHGKPVELYTESELVSLIRDAKTKQQAIADLVDTSSRMKAKHEQLEKDISVYVAALDAIK